MQGFKVKECKMQNARLRLGVLHLLLDDCEEVSGVDGGGFLDGNLCDFALLGGLDLVLHLHGFDDDQALTGFDLIAFGGDDADDFSGHGSDDFGGASFGSGGGAAAAQRARIADLGGEALGADDDVGFAEERILALGLVVAPVVDDGEHVARGHGDIKGEGFAVHRTFIALVGTFEFDLVQVTIDQDFVFHRPTPSLRAAVFQPLGLASPFDGRAAVRCAGGVQSVLIAGGLRTGRRLLGKDGGGESDDGSTPGGARVSDGRLLQKPVEESGIDAAGLKIRMKKNAAEEGKIGFDAADEVLDQGAAQAVDHLRAILRHRR